MTTKLDHLQDHCQTFTDSLADCASVDQALALKDRICSSLHDTCRSTVVRDLLDEHARQLILDRFGSSGLQS